MSASPEFLALSAAAKALKPGRYRHFKGGEYTVLGVGKHTETLEEFVVYRPNYRVNDELFSLRPLSNFLEPVDREDYHGPRFTYLGD